MVNVVKMLNPVNVVKSKANYQWKNYWSLPILSVFTNFTDFYQFLPQFLSILMAMFTHFYWFLSIFNINLPQ